MEISRDVGRAETGARACILAAQSQGIASRSKVRGLGKRKPGSVPYFPAVSPPRGPLQPRAHPVGGGAGPCKNTDSLRGFNLLARGRKGPASPSAGRRAVGGLAIENNTAPLRGLAIRRQAIGLPFRELPPRRWAGPRASNGREPARERPPGGGHILSGVVPLAGGRDQTANFARDRQSRQPARPLAHKLVAANSNWTRF